MFLFSFCWFIAFELFFWFCGSLLLLALAPSEFVVGLICNDFCLGADCLVGLVSGRVLLMWLSFHDSGWGGMLCCGVLCWWLKC